MTRTISTLVLVLGAACSTVPPAAPEPEPASEAARSARELSAAPAAASEVPAANDVAGADDVDAQFQKLLAGMGVAFFPGDRLEIAGWVNLQSGVVEVFACAPNGKTHESVVVLDCVPSGLQAGLIALGLEPGTPVRFRAGGAVDPPTGAPVEIELRWKDADGRDARAFAEDWVWDERHGRSMPRGSWIFAGSYFEEGASPLDGGTSEGGTFAADYVKSLATTFHDASSILENAQGEGFDDTVYSSNERAVPPVGTPITAVFRRAR